MRQPTPQLPARADIRRAMLLAVGLTLCAAAPTGAATIPAPAAGQAALAVSVAVRDGALTLVGANGSGVQVLVVGSNSSEQLLDPAFSPDGRRIAYTSRQPATTRHPATSVIYVDALPGGRPRALTAAQSGRLDSGATFSPNGTQIAFSRGSIVPGSAAQILVAPANFGAPRALTSGRSGGRVADDSDPAFSPSGASIAFTRRIGTTSSIWVMRANGANQHQVIANAAQPAWSPNGLHLAFVSTRARRGQCGRRACADLYVAAPSGSGLTRLTSDVFDETAPAWSPDGSRIAYARGTTGPQSDDAVFTIDPNGSCPFRVTGSVTVTAPAWKPRVAAPARPPGC